MKNHIAACTAVFCPYGCPAGTLIQKRSTCSTLIDYFGIDNNCNKEENYCHECRNTFIRLYRIKDNVACYLDEDHRLLAGQKICGICIKK